MALTEKEKLQAWDRHVETAVTALTALARRSHAGCDDPWYSCPKHPEGCANDDAVGCTCGADEHNAKVDAVLIALKGSAT